jgi:cobalt-zinc-cadmium efflux system outer membrane protein
VIRARGSILRKSVWQQLVRRSAFARACAAARGSATLATLALCAGCASVNPRPDFERTTALVSERTGADEVYDPAADALVQQKVAALLADGLTTDEAGQVALLNNRQLQALFQEIGVSRAEVVQSGLLSNPALGLSLRFPDGGGLANLGVGFAQQLADLWRIPVRKQIAEAQLEQTILTVARRAVELVTEARVQYCRSIALRRAGQIAAEDLGLVQRSLELAQDRFDAGEVGVLDVNLARANLFDVQLELIVLGRDQDMADADLARVLGLSQNKEPWWLSGRLPDEPLPEMDAEGLLLVAMRQRLDARAAALRVREAEAEIKRQCLHVLPEVALGAELERPELLAPPGRKILADTARASARSGQLTAPDIQTRGERRLENSGIVDTLLGPTLDITLPIWDQNQAQIAKARYQALQRRKEYEDLLDAVAQEVAQSFAAARAGRKLVEFYRDQALPLAQQNVEAARRAYQAGEQSIVALIDAQKALIAQRREYLNAQRDFAIALAELERAVGGHLRTEVPTTQPAEAPATTASQPVGEQR